MLPPPSVILLTLRLVLIRTTADWAVLRPEGAGDGGMGGLLSTFVRLMVMLELVGPGVTN